MSKSLVPQMLTQESQDIWQRLYDSAVADGKDPLTMAFVVPTSVPVSAVQSLAMVDALAIVSQNGAQMEVLLNSNQASTPGGVQAPNVIPAERAVAKPRQFAGL